MGVRIHHLQSQRALVQAQHYAVLCQWRALLASSLHAPLSGCSLSRDSQSKASHGHSVTTKRAGGFLEVLPTHGQQTPKSLYELQGNPA